MQAPRTVQQLSDDINNLATEITAMSQGMRDREYASFVGGTPAQQAPIVARLQLTDAQVGALVASARQTATGVLARRPGDAHRQPQPWDYDTKTATVADLTARRSVLETRLRVLHYLRSL